MVARLLIVAVLLGLTPSYADSTGAAVTSSVELEPTRGGDDLEVSHLHRIRRAQRWRAPLVTVGNLLVLVPPAIYYWSSTDLQSEDWELKWDWASWKSKLVSTDGLVLDTNRFEANGIRHPLAGALSFQVGRANGYGLVGSTVIAFATSVLWEYLAEFPEKPSVNDVFTNTASGVLIGEPLFQIGRLGDGTARLPRRLLSLIASPFHRTQQLAGVSPLARETSPASQFELLVGANAVQHDQLTPRGEVRLGLDLALVRDRSFGLPGEGTSWTGASAWSRVALDLRLGGADASMVTGARFRTTTSYLGRYARRLAHDGSGTATFLGVGGGFELGQRRLTSEWDALSIFQLAGLRAGGNLRDGDRDVTLELAAYGDVAMVQAHVFGLTPRMTDSSVLLTRGYYYATGVSLVARLRARLGRFSAELEGTSHQFWSFDDHSYGGAGDPRDVRDQRLIGTALVGARLGDRDVRLYLFWEGFARSGHWEAMTRRSLELDSGVILSAGF